MSFDEEWSLARANARPAVGGFATADLEFNQDHIGAVGTEAFHLHGRLHTDGRHAAKATAEAAAALTNEGFASGPALHQAQSRWESQLQTLLAACANISNGLDYSLSSHAKEEHELYAAFTASKLDQLLT
ncbi:hypothetical protein ABZ924_28115 [Streptomyces sp. NPDC046876]|uniref:hypothetical protein n=1 Tax=Streptomyces sp. NPDC046876 TaxID=3155616 RepID=UPI0033DC4CD7